MPIWSAERVISRKNAIELIELQFPQLKPIRAAQSGYGWDNTAFLVNNEFIFRFPRRESAVARLESEMAVLPQLAPQLPLLIPHPIYFGTPSPSFPWPFVGYRLIPGETACRANLDESKRESMAQKLGEFLRNLHSLPANDYELPGDCHGVLDVSLRIPKIEENIDVVMKSQLVDRSTSFEQVLSDANGLEPQTPGVVVHGDLYVRHFVLDADDHIRGIIDWGDLQRNDPALDLAVVYNFFPPGKSRDRFWKEYGHVNKQTRRLARLSALDHILSVLRYGSKVGDADLIREGKIGVNYVLYDGE